jgi:SDR family mycofactocin-dependent oxidoreductase
MPGRVEGKVAFITGAARGQGRSHAVRLAEEGADIIAVDICETVPAARRFYEGPTEADLAETAKLVESHDRRVVTATVDVRDYAALKAALDDGVAQLGGLDIVCANAGIFLHSDKTHEVTESDWDDTLDINLKGVWQTAKAAVPILIEQGRGGSIILTGSTGSLKGAANVAPYIAAKHGVHGLMKVLSNELAPYDVRVNCVHPTGVATPMLLNDTTYGLFRPDVPNATQDDARPVFVSTNSLAIPWVEPVDVSNAVLYLASDEARYVTGTDLKVDAGYTTK